MKESAYVPLRLVPCDLILRPGAGATVQGAFANARALASVTSHEVIVEGNGVQVVVRPGMSEDACQQAYEDALDQIRPPGTPYAWGRARPRAALSAERDALIATLVAEYADVLAQRGSWRWHGRHTTEPEALRLPYLRGAQDALWRLKERLGLEDLDLHARAAEVVAHESGEEGP